MTDRIVRYPEGPKVKMLTLPLLKRSNIKGTVLMPDKNGELVGQSSMLQVNTQFVEYT